MNQNGVIAFPENMQMEDLQKMNAVLMRAKDVLLKKQGYMKGKHERKVTKLTDKIEHLTNKIAEQDKVNNIINDCNIGDKAVPDEDEGLYQEQPGLSECLDLQWSGVSAHA